MCSWVLYVWIYNKQRQYLLKNVFNYFIPLKIWPASISFYIQKYWHISNTDYLKNFDQLFPGRRKEVPFSHFADRRQMWITDQDSDFFMNT